MSAPIIKGWCPGALRPMMSGDGLVVRIRPRGGRLMPGEMRGIATLAQHFGNGLIDLSARANLQLRGVTPENHPAVIDGLSALGLIDHSAEEEARRNIVVTPFWTEGDGTADLAQRLARKLARADAPRTPGKFGFVVDTGAAAVLSATSADIRIERAAAGLIVRADGAVTGAPVTVATAIDTALDLARWFLATGGAPGGRGGMAAHLPRGAILPAIYRATKAVHHPPAPVLAPGSCQEGVLAAFAFGQCDAGMLAALADIGPIRITPWRMVLIEGATDAPAIAGLITDARDPLLKVVACTGAPGCPQAQGTTRPLARRLAPLVPAGRMLHVSGCAKGCAHPGAAAATLVARGADRFDLILDGTATGQPAATDLGPDTLSAPALFPTG